MPVPERREQERFPYLDGARPLLILGNSAYEIIDIGERGLRARCGDADRWLLGSIVEGWVWFQRDSRIQVEGLVVRAGAGELVLRLAGSGIPATTLLEELRYARRSDA